MGPMWRGARAVEGARLESVCAATPYRGFESLSLRHPPSRGMRYGVMPRRSEVTSKRSVDERNEDWLFDVLRIFYTK